MKLTGRFVGKYERKIKVVHVVLEEKQSDETLRLSVNFKKRIRFEGSSIRDKFYLKRLYRDIKGVLLRNGMVVVEEYIHPNEKIVEFKKS